MGAVLYGECVNGRASAAVRISALDGTGCRLESESSMGSLGTDFALWIGAIGPLAATAKDGDDQHLDVLFKEPLDSKILDHFNCG